VFIVDENTFDTLIREYYPRVVGYISLLHSRVDAEDISQDVFAILWEKRHSLNFNDESHLNAWLLRVAKTKSIDRLRRKKSSSVVRSLDSLTDIEIDYLMTHGDEVFEKLGRKDLFERILDLSDELPEIRKKVFRLSYLNDMSSKDISELLGLPLRTVENHLYQSLKYLRSKTSPLDFVLLFIFISQLP